MTAREQERLIEQRIGARIYAARVRRGLQLKTAADAARVHPHTLSRIEQGYGCSAAKLIRIAVVVGLQLGELAAKVQ